VTKEERAKARALCDALPFGWWDADFAHGARTLLPAALSDLDRLERGLREIATITEAVNTPSRLIVRIDAIAHAALDGTAPNGGTDG
jgi:hypothetical protein